MQDHKPTAGWGDLFAGRNAIVSLTLVGGVALHAINVFIATTILPTVVADIGGMDYYAWNTALFVTASILGSALVPRLLSQAGPRSAYLIAAVIFAAGTLTCGLAPSMPVMLAGRAIQGLGGGMMLALSYSMIRIVFDEALWPRAIGLVSGMWGVATLVGPAIGGVFAELGIWRAAFWSLAPVIAVFTIMAMTVLPRESGSAASNDRLAWPQLILLTAAVLAVSAGSISSEMALNAGGVVLAIVLLLLLAAVERKPAVVSFRKARSAFGSSAHSILHLPSSAHPSPVPKSSCRCSFKCCTTSRRLLRVIWQPSWAVAGHLVPSDRRGLPQGAPTASFWPPLSWAWRAW